jgi:hypothetical protein
MTLSSYADISKKEYNTIQSKNNHKPRNGLKTIFFLGFLLTFAPRRTIGRLHPSCFFCGGLSSLFIFLIIKGEIIINRLEMIQKQQKTH